jgi:hypothetical protein
MSFPCQTACFDIQQAFTKLQTIAIIKTGKNMKTLAKGCLFLLIAILLCNCVNKKVTENETTNNLDYFPINKRVYVASFDGLNLRSNYGVNSEKLKLLPQNTELTVIEKSEEKETIDKMHDYWYRVDTGNETGWVFGGYLFHEPVNNKIRNMEIAKIIADVENSKFWNDGSIMSLKGTIGYNNNDTLKVYDTNSKESRYFLTDHHDVFLFKLEETPGWFYVISSDYEIQGYLYLYEISEKSFYGDLEKNKNSGNYYRYLLNTEYDIIRQHKNIKRYGPLLTINLNGKIIEFLDTRYGTGFAGLNYLIIDYYPNYNEILMYEQYYEGGNYFIYNLEFGEVRCKFAMSPNFNKSRTYFLTYGWESEALSTTLRVYRINNGFYQEIANKNIYIDQSYSINGIVWVNDHEAHIDCGEVGKITVEIGDEVKVSNNLTPMIIR